MRIAVIGGGTAGYMALAQLSHFFPGTELFHIFDSAIPPIGVGEGTLPAFKSWIQALTNAAFLELERICQATPKIGVCFEGWGKINHRFHHYFVGNRQAYHLSASRLPTFLQPYIHAKHIDKHVSHLQSSDRQVNIQFSDNTHLTTDVVFDATGFPRHLGEDQILLKNIPTNAAFVWRREFVTHMNETRAVARPHGWIFVIPLTASTSYGYIYNHQINQEKEVLRDFEHFLHHEGVTEQPIPRNLRFPSFVIRNFFDGVIFRIGNTASFLEPLEATAIALTLEELRLASLWLADGLFGITPEEKWNAYTIELLNNHLVQTVQAIAQFVSWHYARSSMYNTSFWRYAQANYKENILNPANLDITNHFSKFTQAAGQISPSELMKIRETHFYEQKIEPHLTLAGELGGFSIPSFAQIGYGIGDYPPG